MIITTAPIAVLGFEQWRATVTLETGTVVYETVRWSERSAYESALAWTRTNS